MGTIVRLFTFVKPYWWASMGSLALIVAVTFFRMVPALLTKPILDQAIPNRDVNQALTLVLLFVGASLFGNLLSATELYAEQFVGQKVIYDIRNFLYRHLQSQSMSFYDKNQVGQLMSRVTNDVSQVQFFLTQGFARLINTVVTIGAYLIAMLWLDVRLTIVALLVGPGIWYLQRELRTVMPIMRRVQKLNGDLNVLIQEYVSGVKMIQGFGREDHEAERFDEVNRGIRSARMEQQTKMAMVMPGQEFFSNVSLVIILAYGAWLVIEGSMSVGALGAFSTLALTMWQPVRWFGMINQMSQQAVAAGDRVFEILDTPFDVAERQDAVLIARLQGKVEFDHVSFAYGKDRPLLEDITFTAEPGQTIAIVGPSGSGKTTIINLIPRFYDVTAGSVKVDDVNVRDVQLAPLRSQMSMVLQETFLFNMSIRGNIRYGRPEATIEEVEAAAKAAHAHDFILGLSEGYDTLVGERGARLSGGQRQRIAIARALLVDPKILILDEATSSVDSQTDAGIQAALDHLMQDRTTIVIAHRISTVQRADLILVLEKGKIVGRGTHDELLRHNATYAHLWEMQMHLQAQESGEAPVAQPELEVTR